MRILASFTAALLFMFLLASGPSFAQDDKPDHPQDQQQKDKDKETKSKPDARQDEKTRQDENKREESRPEGRQDNARPENARPEEARPQEQSRPENARPEEGRPQEQTRPEQRDERGVRPQEQARPDQGGNTRPMQAGRGQRIPEEKFRAHFGREHHFRVQRAEIVNQSQPQFVYGGYTFVLQQPWPSDWSYDDDCYVDYVDDSYYLYDLNHPGIQILIFVIG